MTFAKPSDNMAAGIVTLPSDHTLYSMTSSASLTTRPSLISFLGDTTSESKSRRILESRLLHNYLINLSQPFPVSQDENVNLLWRNEVPSMALKEQHENLMNAMFAISASHLLLNDPDNWEFETARDTYLVLALREQRIAVEHLTVENVDATCLTSILILINAFANLRIRTIQPYKPPIDWIRLGKSTCSILKVALDEGQEMKSPQIKTIVEAPPLLNNQSILFHPQNRDRKPFLALLNAELLPAGHTMSEPWDSGTRKIYEEALSYIGSIARAVEDNEPIYAICRRLTAFTLLMPDGFDLFVQEMRPRALLVLAHFFALATRVRVVWWVGNTPQRELDAIKTSLPPELYCYWEEVISMSSPP